MAMTWEGPPASLTLHRLAALFFPPSQLTESLYDYEMYVYRITLKRFNKYISLETARNASRLEIRFDRKSQPSNDRFTHSYIFRRLLVVTVAFYRFSNSLNKLSRFVTGVTTCLARLI